MQYPKLIDLYTRTFGRAPSKVTPLARSGSDRQYFRMVSPERQAIGVFNPDAKENLAFVEFTRHFAAKGIRVPEIYAEDLSENVYLLQDLGDTTLFARLTEAKKEGEFPAPLQDIYQKVLTELPKIQVVSGKDLDYSLCYPRSEFDRQSMMWDLNYFKYYFLKLAGITFDEQALENDYQKFTDFLLEAPRDFFLYRDFQSRNIMIHHDDIFFIDYQGGRRGALQYDVASLLYDAKADIPRQKRNELLDFYINNLKKYLDFDEQQWRNYYTGFVIIRILQAMGAYGFRGFYEKKAHFLASIPYALDNLAWVLEHYTLPLKLNTLIPVLQQVVKSEKLRSLGSTVKKLTVHVNSFSYKRGIPVDESGHGGGFAFDCRALPNPGRYEQYKHLTGKDLSVIEFLEKEEAVHYFFRHASALAEQSVKRYLERHFDHLTINFGCTGGQHRSVYMAERMARWLKNSFNVHVELRHREQEMKK